MANTAKHEPEAFGAMLLSLRVAAGLTQEQLAARAGLSPSAISALESGKRHTPRFATVELLSAALALDVQRRHDLFAAARSTSSGATGALGTVRASTVASADPGTGSHVSRGGTARDSRRYPWRSVVEPTPLVGRTHELDTILRLLASEGMRLLTLTGPAGVGKTRLALEAAARLTTRGERFPDGVVFVDLTPLRDPALVLNSLAAAIGLLDTSSRPVLERLVEVLEQRSQLVVLDNFEQVLFAADSLNELLAACPTLALLVTSRVPLQLRWERVLRVPPLPVPDLAAPLPPLDALAANPSVALFVQRAQARQPDFLLTVQLAPFVARLVTQLDGLPLALELAAARLDVLPLPALVGILGDRLELLASQAPDLPKRQRSLEAAIGWSYDLLSASEQRLFRCLGVFVGQVSLYAIAEVVRAVGAAGSPAGDWEAREVREVGAGGRMLQPLLSLAEQSLLLPLQAQPEDPVELEVFYQPFGRSGQWGSAGGSTEARGLEEDDKDYEPTFALLETVREYAQEQLAVEGELAVARRAHAHCFLALAERAGPALRGRGQRAWFFWLESEHDNLRAALRWLLDQDDPVEREAGLQLTGALGYFWYLRGYHAEGRRWLEETLAHAPRREDGSWVDSAARLRALIAAGPLLMVQEDYARAQDVLKEAVVLAERQQDPVVIAEANTYLGHATVVGRDVEGGMRRLQEAVRQWEELGDLNGLGEALFYLGYAADVIGDATAAAAHYTVAVARLSNAGNAQHAGFVHSYLGVLEWKRGKLSSALAHIQAVLQTCVILRDRWLLSFAAQATVALVGSRTQPAAWVRLLGAADAWAQATGGAAFGWEHLPGAEQVVSLREQLALGKEEEWGAAYHDGRTLPFARAAALALRLLEEVARTLGGPDAGSQPGQ